MAILERRIQSKVSRAVFFRELNDVDVYIEDASRETRKLISTLLTRASGMKIAINDVFPLGSKNDVIAACFSDQEPGGRRRVYVVDGDLDWTHSSNVGIKRLYVTSRYCVENYLIDELAIAGVLAENSATMDEEGALAAFDYGNWLRRNAADLHILYSAYALCRVLSPSMRTVSFPIRSMISNASGDVDQEKVSARVAQIKSALIEEHGSETVEEWGAFVENRMSAGSMESKIHAVSGKDVLLPLVRLRMHSIEKISIPDPVLKIRLANYCNPTELARIFEVASV
ncbi:DUF4435 domain-containing protein [Stenotrophomonas maltophilia]